MCDQLHGDGQGHWGAPWLPPDQGAADQGGITAAQKGMSVWECVVCGLGVCGQCVDGCVHVWMGVFMCGWVCPCVDGCVHVWMGVFMCNHIIYASPVPLVQQHVITPPQAMSYCYSSPGQGARLADANAQIRTTGRVCWWSSDRAYERVRREGREGEEGGREGYEGGREGVGGNL